MISTPLSVTATDRPRPFSELLLPPRSLASCVYGAFVRDTRGCRLSPVDRFNHFAAAPLCTLSWFFEGECMLVEPDGSPTRPAGRPVPKIAFSGPQTNPASSWSEGDIHAMMVSFYPDAFRRWSGIEVSDFLDETKPASEVLPSGMMKICREVADIGEARTGFEFLTRELEKRFAEESPAKDRFFLSISDWSKSFAIAASRSGVGRSLRQVERRVRAWTGMTRRDLELHARLENTFTLAAQGAKTGELDPAQIAYQAGFSDQSHMGRNVKRHTGHSPLQLMQRIETDEAYWCYRLIAGMERG